MNALAYDVMDVDEVTRDCTPESSKKNSPSTKLERRRRIEELHEERSFRKEWGDF